MREKFSFPAYYLFSKYYFALNEILKKIIFFSVQPKVSVEQIKDGRRRLGVVAAQAAKWEFPPDKPRPNEK